MVEVMTVEEAGLMIVTRMRGFVDADGNQVAGISKQEAFKEVQTIDRMLIMMKSKSLLNKKRNLNKILGGILSLACGHDDVTPGLSNNHLSI